MKKLNIFIIATGCYNKYLDFLYPTLNKLFPMLEKHIYLISDNNKSYTLDNTIKYNYYHICDLPYPFIAYFKINYIIDCIYEYNIHDDEYFIFLDADSIILEKSNEYWNNLINEININKLCFTISPWKGCGYIENEKNKNSITFLSNQNLNNYIQSSLFFGLIKNLNEILYKYNKYIVIDSKNKFISLYFDQSVLNKLIIDDNLYCKCDYYILNYYKEIKIENLNNLIIDDDDTESLIKYNDYNSIFCIQKFNGFIKDNKRNYKNIKC